MRRFKKGDIVKVWSLQSFNCGGFLKGKEGVVYQDQNEGGSVLVSVVRNFNGENKIDPTYEVYDRQLEFIREGEKTDNSTLKCNKCCSLCLQRRSRE